MNTKTRNTIIATVYGAALGALLGAILGPIIRAEHDLVIILSAAIILAVCGAVSVNVLSEMEWRDVPKNVASGLIWGPVVGAIFGVIMFPREDLGLRVVGGAILGIPLGVLGGISVAHEVKRQKNIQSALEAQAAAFVMRFEGVAQSDIESVTVDKARQCVVVAYHKDGELKERTYTVKYLLQATGLKIKTSRLL
jgi:hypothetical protein